MDEQVQLDCNCERLNVRGSPGDLEVYCPECGKVFRAPSDSAPPEQT